MAQADQWFLRCRLLDPESVGRYITRMSIRRQSREFAVQFLYAYEFKPIGAPSTGLDRLAAQPKNFLRDIEKDLEVDAQVADFAGTLFLGVCESRGEIDRLIEAQARHWKLGRMSAVDLAILRVAVFELKFLKPTTDPGVAINEALELAKLYSSKDASGFVNGILDPIAHSR